MGDLLSITELPETFSYPRVFLKLVELGLVDLEPWEILLGDRLRTRHDGLARRFPDRRLVPFALRQDNDDVASWDLQLGHGAVVVIHDFSSPGWEQRAEYDSFNDWLRQAVQDLIDFE